MDGKLDVYDTLGVMMPGALIVSLIPICYPAVLTKTHAVQFPDGFAVVALLALSVFIGQLIQAISSLMEPLVYLTWGCRPSDVALESGLGDRYLPRDTAKRIRAKLASAVTSDATDHSLFLFAAHRAEGFGRVSKFNSLYAYHRALLTTVLVGLLVTMGATRWGLLAHSTWETKTIVLMAFIMILLLLWYRAKQRAFYYVREVLLAAERILDSEGNASP
jgi:hypothetical protein